MRRTAALLLAAAVLAWAAPAAAARETEEAFTERMAVRIRAAMPDHQVRIAAPGELAVIRPGHEQPAQVFVGRIWNYCESATAEECETSVAHFITVMRSSITETGTPATRAQLRVVVRHGDYCGALAEMGRGQTEEQRTLQRTFPPDLCEVVMVDYPDRMRGLNGTELTGLGLTAAEVWALAERQTLANLPEPRALQGLNAGQLVALTDFEYIPSLLVNRDGWRRAAAGGPLIVAVPADNLMIVVRESAITDMAGFRRLTRQAFEEAERQISDKVYRWTDAGWAVVGE